MKMNGQIRVATDAKYKEIYNNMKNKGVIEDFHDLFFVCAILGYKNNKLNPIKKNDDRFWSSTILPREWVVYYAMILEKNNYNYSLIENEKEVLNIIEQYANAGIEILINNFLDDYLISNSKQTEPKLDPSCSLELPKHFLHFLYEQSDYKV